MTFALGLLVASIGWFVLFTIAIVTYTLKLSDGLEKKALAVKAAVEHMLPYYEKYDAEADRRLNEAMAAIQLLLPDEEEV